MKGQLYEADGRVEHFQRELNMRESQLHESKDLLKTLQVEKNALIQENKAQEVQIKNLLEELKLTKAAAGDSGSQIGELSKSLRAAQANAEKFEKEAEELRKTLETRTQNFLKEKADIRTELEKALADLKAVDKNQSGMSSENDKLKEEVTALKKKLTDTELQLDIIQDNIQAKVEELVNMEREKLKAVEQMEKMA